MRLLVSIVDGVAPLRRLPPRIIGPDDERDAGSNEEGLPIPEGREVVEDPSMLMLEDERKLLLVAAEKADADGDVDEAADEAATSTDGEDVGDCCCCDMISSQYDNQY